LASDTGIALSGTARFEDANNRTNKYCDPKWTRFYEMRKVIALANLDVFFIDPYLDEEFVTRYLPHIRNGVDIRLLTSDLKKLTQLLPAVDLFTQQNGYTVSVRSTTGLHDRYIFVDRGAATSLEHHSKMAQNRRPLR
jgi:hypothetical protein